MPHRVLIVDDEASIRELLYLVLKRDGYAVEVAENGRVALDLIRKRVFDVIISDINMPDVGGIELLEQVRANSPETVVIMITAFATVETAWQASKLGAEHFIIKDSNFDPNHIKILVRKALEKTELKQHVELLKKEFRSISSLDNIVGKAPRMQALFRMIETVAQTNATVLITGESGTGKELVARAIHNHSPRLDAPFVSVNCGAFTETLLESELFGYMKGAFTGAAANRKGLFEAASGGTIFLDEVGEMSLPMQVKLLRVLQERSVRRVGGVEEIPIDVRIISATNRNLEAHVGRGEFREDLFYRVSVIPIEIPPLRERAEDIPELVDHFLTKLHNLTGRPKLKVAPEAMNYLLNYRWPGNVRELENAIEYGFALEMTDTIQPERLPRMILNYSPAEASASARLPETGIDLVAHISEIEKTFILEALKRTHGNQTKSAQLLGLSVRSLRHLLDKYSIRGFSGQLRERTEHDD